VKALSGLKAVLPFLHRSGLIRSLIPNPILTRLLRVLFRAHALIPARLNG